MSREVWLDRAVEALRQPIATSPDLRGRILAEISERNGPNRGWVWAAAVVLVTVGGWQTLFRSEPSPKPTAIRFGIELPDASHVTLVGDFNDWSPERTPLVRGTGNLWEATVPLRRGFYRYAFLVDDARWLSDPKQPGPVDADYGQPTSLVTVE